MYIKKKEKKVCEYLALYIYGTYMSIKGLSKFFIWAYTVKCMLCHIHARPYGSKQYFT